MGDNSLNRSDLTKTTLKEDIRFDFLRPISSISLILFFVSKLYFFSALVSLIF